MDWVGSRTSQHQVLVMLHVVFPKLQNRFSNEPSRPVAFVSRTSAGPAGVKKSCSEEWGPQSCRKCQGSCCTESQPGVMPMEGSRVEGPSKSDQILVMWFEPARSESMPRVYSYLG